jgi:hypothetical protein
VHDALNDKKPTQRVLRWFHSFRLFVSVPVGTCVSTCAAM